MDIDAERSVVSSTTAPTAMPVQQVPVQQVPVQQVAEPVVVAAGPVEREVHDVRTRRTISFPAIFAGVLAALMMIIGGALMARAGVDDSLGDPVVTVAGIDGTAVGGMVLLALGLGLLFAAFSGERGAILFLSVLIGIAAAIIAIEPTVADGNLGFSRGFGVLLALAAGAVALASALTPTVRMSSHRVERV